MPVEVLLKFNHWPSSHLPSERVHIIRELCDITVKTGQDAVFEIELSHSGVNGEWWLGDNLLQNNDLNQMSSHGKVHRLSLKMVTTDESGDVAFVVGEERSVACLVVEEKPKGKGEDMVSSDFFTHPSPSTTKQLCLGYHTIILHATLQKWCLIFAFIL